VKFNIKSLFSVIPWSTDWQNQLSEAVQNSQTGLAINMVVIVTRESDIYTELLYVLSFLGMSIGALVGYFLPEMGLSNVELLAFPLAGFALGSTIFTFRKHYIHKIASRAVRERVASRAKAHFFDHHAQMEGSLALLFFSEMEREVLFLASPEISNSLPQFEVQGHLEELLKNYEPSNPMAALAPCLKKIGGTLRAYVPEESKTKGMARVVTSRYFVGASDRPSQPLNVPIIKGNKEIN
jgi:uncharacterized membrane protein